MSKKIDQLILKVNASKLKDPQEFGRQINTVMSYLVKKRNYPDSHELIFGLVDDDIVIGKCTMKVNFFNSPKITKLDIV